MKAKKNRLSFLIESLFFTNLIKVLFREREPPLLLPL